MAQTETKVTLFSCDANDCNRTAIAEDHEDGTSPSPASGIIGTVSISESLGGGSVEWFAHAPVHIRKAVQAILAKTGPANTTESTSDDS